MSKEKTEEITDVTIVEAAPVPAVSAPPAALPISPLLSMIMDKNLEPDRVSSFMKIQQDYETDEARKAYHMDMASFRAEVPVLKKDAHVSFAGKNGSADTDYRHTSLGHMMSVINPLLGKHGFNISWSNRQADGFVFVVCTVTHRLGFSVSDELFSSPDTSGGKNNIQQIKSTITYLRRATAESVLGLASENADDDDGQAGGAAPVELVTEDQAAQLQDYIAENEFPLDETLAWLKIESLADLEERYFKRTMSALKKRAEA